MSKIIDACYSRYQTIQLLAQGREGIVGSEDGTAFTPELNREFATVLNILLGSSISSGSMKTNPVERPSDEGTSTICWSILPVTAKVQEVRGFLDRFSAERQALTGGGPVRVQAPDRLFLRAHSAG
ncbi:hypothetical protein [Streptomyces sp. NPDC096934]|uniref:hypothetical protein n=1 Tax=Streptomyces sp. NPDC096934 TaxID=3155551 RepID=UPI00332E4695